MPDGFAPVELAPGARDLARPQHPGGEDPIEERLHQGRAKEALTPLALKADAERLFQRRPHCFELRRVAGCLDSRQPVAGIRGEQPSQILGFGQSGLMGQRATEIFTQPGADFAREGTRCLQPVPERFRIFRQPEGLQLRRPANCILAEQHKVARIGHQHQPIAAPVAAHHVCRQPGVITGGLHLDHATFRHLPLAWPALL